MKRLLPILLCILAFAAPRLYGQTSYTVTFSADPIDGGTVTAENTVTYAMVSSGASVAENTFLKFKAEPKEGYEFDNWTVNGLPAEGSVIDPTELSREITGETSVVAHFKSAAPAEEYTVTFAAEPEGQGTLTATHYDRENDEEVPFESGEKFSGESIFITFTAKPGADYKVEKWLVNGEAIDMPSNPNEYIHELKADVEVKVVFTAKPNEVTLQYSVPTGEGGQIAVAVTPKGGGDAVSVESGKKVARGSSVTLTATPSEGYEVEKWLVNGSEDRQAGQNTTLTMTLEEDTDVQLYFKKEAAKYVVNFTADPVKGGTITASGYVNVRTPDDYIAQMIELAGGKYAFSAEELGDQGARSSVNMDPEQFYAAAKDADILIYNSTVEGEISSLNALTEKSPLMKDCKAVLNGTVWCTGQNMFQQVSGTAEMISDFHAVISGDTEQPLRFLHRLS